MKPSEIVELYIKKKKDATIAAKCIACVPKESKGGKKIPARELNKSSRGKNFAELMKTEEPSIGIMNPDGKNQIQDHVDGHRNTPGPEHHNGPHEHVTDQKGNKYIIRYDDNEPKDLSKCKTVQEFLDDKKTSNKVPGFLKGIPKPIRKRAFVLSSAALIGASVLDAAPSERSNVIAKEATSFTGSAIFTGAIGLLTKSTLPGLIGGIIGGCAFDALFDYVAGDNISEEEKRQIEERERIKQIEMEKKRQEEEKMYQEAKKKLLTEEYAWDLYREVQRSEPGKDLQYYVNKMDQIINERLNEERGGIILSGKVDVCSKLKFNLNSIDKMFLDYNGNLILISNKGKDKISSKNIEINEEDFLVALAVVYNQMEISFSLDPWDPLNPDGPYFQKVFYPNVLSNTKLGNTMFVADYCMKKLSFGTERIPNKLKSEMDFILDGTNEKSAKKTKPSLARLWLVTDKVSINVNNIEKDGATHHYLEFGDVKMRACSKILVVDPSKPSGLRDCEEPENKNSSNQLFAKELTRKYDIVCKKYPEFERLRNLAKVIALANYLYDNKVEIDKETLLESLKNHGIKTNQFINIGPLKANKHKHGEEKVPRITTSKTKKIKDMNYTSTLTGGVDLKSNVKCNIKKSDQLPKEFNKQFLDSISNDLNKRKQSMKIKMPNGDDAFALPLNLISSQFLTNETLLKGESLINQNPSKSFEIASLVALLDNNNRRAFNLLGNALKKINNNRDAIEAFNFCLKLAKTEQEFEESKKLAEIESNKLQSKEPSLVPVFFYGDYFLVYAPSDWYQLSLTENDENTSRIFISNPRSFIPENKVEMLTINEFFNASDIGSFLKKINKIKNLDRISSIYKNLVKNYFSFDKNTSVYGFYYEVDQDRTFVYLNLYGEINGERYRNYHCWIVPDESLKMNSTLFLLISCTDRHGNWMDEWASKIFKESAKCDKEQVKKMKMQFDTKEKEVSLNINTDVKNRKKKFKRNDDDDNFDTVHYTKIDNNDNSDKYKVNDKRKINSIWFIIAFLLLIFILAILIIIKFKK